MVIARNDVSGLDMTDIVDRSAGPIGPIMPGEVLRDWMEDLGLNATRLAKAINVPTNRITAILSGQREITAGTALLSWSAMELRARRRRQH